MTDISLLPKDKRPKEDKKDHQKMNDYDFVFSKPKENKSLVVENNNSQKDKKSLQEHHGIFRAPFQREESKKANTNPKSWQEKENKSEVKESLNKEKHNTVSKIEPKKSLENNVVKEKQNDVLLEDKVEKKEDLEIKDIGGGSAKNKKQTYTQGKTVKDTIDVSFVKKGPKGLGLSTGNKVIIMVIVFVVMLVVCFGLYFYYNWRIGENNKKIEEIKNNRKEAESLVEAKYNFFERERKITAKLSVVEDLFQSHGNSLKLFDFLEQKTLPEIYYNNITFDRANNLVALEAISPDYLKASQQLKVFEDDNFFLDKVKVSGLNLEENKTLKEESKDKKNKEEDDYLLEKNINFDMQFSFKEGVLK